MRKVSMATRAELVAAISGRYVLGGRAEKARMLDEFVALTGFHRKNAVRLLRGDCAPAKSGPRPRRRVFGDEVRTALVVVWEASDRICGKRLHPLLPSLIEAMERHGQLLDQFTPAECANYFQAAGYDGLQAALAYHRRS